jgi:hypothetical protein
MLAGLAVQTLASALDPLDQITATRTSSVPELYTAWSGRWLLVGDGEIHLDAGGLLGCFYGEDVRGRTWASSSAALLEKAIAAESPLAPDPRRLRYERGLNWYPPPRARQARIRRLLPSQTLDLREGSVRARSLLPPIDPRRGYDQTLETLGDALVVALQRLPRDRDPVWLSLSAGLDSRTVLAAAAKSSVAFALFTYVGARTPPADRLIPPRLARELGHDLTLLRRGRRGRRRMTRARMQLVIAHSGGHVAEGDAQPILHGSRDALDGVATGGWGFGVGKALNREGLPPTLDDPAQVARRIGSAFGEPEESGAVAGLREWLEWTLETPQDHLDWRDRFYIEQRLAGWQSSKEQVYDMMALERIPIINSARCYALLLEVDEPVRASLRHQRDLVERMCPRLARHPANPSVGQLGLAPVTAAMLRDDPVRALRAVGRRVTAPVRGR